MTFETTDKINNWVKQHCKECHSFGAAGEQFEFRFLPTGIVECQTVECIICKKKITDYV